MAKRPGNATGMARARKARKREEAIARQAAFDAMSPEQQAKQMAANKTRYNLRAMVRDNESMGLYEVP